MADDNYCRRGGRFGGPHGSGSATQFGRKAPAIPRWDDSVRAAIAGVTTMATPPPTNFPPRVTIRFDVQQETERVMQ